MDGNTKLEFEKELDELYIKIGDANGDVDNEIYDRVHYLQDMLFPYQIPEPLPIDCNCGRGDCWECVYKDDPMGI